MIKILYIHHCPVFGGASKSLLEAIKALPDKSVEATFILPRRGNVMTIFNENGFNDVIPTFGVSQFDNTYYGYYRLHRWLILLREMFFLPATLISIWKARRSGKYFDIIHINEITQLPGIIFARLLFPKIPIIMHVRSLLNTELKYRTKIMNYIISNCVDRFIAIDKSVDQTLSLSIPGDVIHNGFKLKSYEISHRGEENPVCRIAFVSNLLPSKGIYDYLEASKIALKKGSKIEFIILGSPARRPPLLIKLLLSVIGFYRDTEKDVKDFIAQNKLEESVEFLGFVKDVSSILSSIDVLCFPSHLNALGRPIFEAAFYKKPSIVTTRDPLPDDVFVDDVTGIRVMEKSPQKLSEAFCYAASHREEMKGMGEAAYELATRNFDIQKNAQSLLKVYQSLIEN